MKTKEIILTAVYVVLVTTLCVTCNIACTNFSSSSSEDSTNHEEISSQPSYIWIGDALENGKIRYGMTYDEIVEIAGSPSSKHKIDGVVYAASYHRSGSYGGIHLRFDSYGRLSSYSDTTED